MDLPIYQESKTQSEIIEMYVKDLDVFEGKTFFIYLSVVTFIVIMLIASYTKDRHFFRLSSSKLIVFILLAFIGYLISYIFSFPLWTVKGQIPAVNSGYFPLHSITYAFPRSLNLSSLPAVFTFYTFACMIVNRLKKKKS